MLILLFLSQFLLTNDSIFSKYIYAGASTIVPKQETWYLMDAYIADGDLYNIQISATNFKSYYNAGDTIRPPYYISDMELLSDKSIVKYVLRFYKKKSTNNQNEKK